MASRSVLPFLLPRGDMPVMLRRQYLQRLRSSTPQTMCPSTSHQIIRAASSKPPPSKPKVLEKPLKYIPPSHPQRVKAPPRTYGAPLSEEEKDKQKKKSYPNMMPGEGTWMRWFLTSRWPHFVISMGTLLFLTVWAVVLDFRKNSVFTHLLPEPSGLIYHPIDTVKQFFHVYKLHMHHTSEVNKEKRAAKNEDVKRIKEFRIAHGFDAPDSNGPRVDDYRLLPEVEARQARERAEAEARGEEYPKRSYWEKLNDKLEKSLEGSTSNQPANRFDIPSKSK